MMLAASNWEGSGQIDNNERFSSLSSLTFVDVAAGKNLREKVDDTGIAAATSWRRARGYARCGVGADRRRFGARRRADRDREGFGPLRRLGTIGRGDHPRAVAGD